MHLTIFQYLAFTFIFSCSLALNSRLLEQNLNTFANRSEEGPVKIAKRGETKYVFMHLILGSAYSYTTDNWIDDIKMIQGKGVDALALNIGQDDWELKQVAAAYAAAQSVGTNFKLFISFDLTAMSCSLPNLVNIVNQFANHPNQFKVDGKAMISSFEGECLGNSGWASLKGQTNGYNMPFISGLEGSFSHWDALDSWYCWGCAFKTGNATSNISMADDIFYLNELGNRYATTVGPWMFTHFPYKNWFQSGGEWFLNIRWEELVSMRNNLTFVEMVTWNDFGESDYFGPITAVGNEAWVSGFPHTAWFDMSQYYISAFKSGSYPAISKDVIYYWARPHPAKATASNDPIARPPGFDTAEDFMWAVAFAISKATVTLQCGSSSSTFDVTPGVTKLKIPLSSGGMSVKMIRNGQTILSETANNYTYNLNPTLYNYNAWVGSATAVTSPNDTQTSTSLIPSSSSLSTQSSSTPITITTFGTSTAIPPTSSVASITNTSTTGSTHTSKSTESSSSSLSTQSSSAPIASITTLGTSTTVPPTSSAASIPNTHTTHYTSKASKYSSSSRSTKTSSAPTASITTSGTCRAISPTSSAASIPNTHRTHYTSKSSKFSKSTKFSSTRTPTTTLRTRYTAISPTSSIHNTHWTYHTSKSSIPSRSTKTSSARTASITTLRTRHTAISPTSSIHNTHRTHHTSQSPRSSSSSWSTLRTSTATSLTSPPPTHSLQTC